MPDPLSPTPSSAIPPPPSFAGDAGERAALLAQARASISGRRLVEALGAPCLAGLSWPALAALARGEPVDPTGPRRGRTAALPAVASLSDPCTRRGPPPRSRR